MANTGPNRFDPSYSSDPASPVTNAFAPTAAEVYDPGQSGGQQGAAVGPGTGQGPNRFGREYSSDPNSPVTNAMQPTAPEVYGGAQPPPYLAFPQLFQRQYPNMPEGIHRMAQSVFEHIDALFSNKDQWHPVAQNYDYGQFLRDVAVAAAAKGEAVGKVVQKIKKPEPAKTTGPQ